MAMMGDDGGYEITLGAVDAELSIMVQVRPESVDIGTAADGELKAGENDCTVAAADTAR